MIGAEKVARALLQGTAPKYRFDLVDEEEVRRALATVFPGHDLPAAMDDRALILAAEVGRCQAVIDYLSQVLELAFVLAAADV